MSIKKNIFYIYLFYYFKNEKIKQEDIDNILSTAKNLLFEYTVKM